MAVARTPESDEMRVLDAGDRLGGAARLVAYYTPAGVVAAFAVASLLTARALFGPAHAGAHWWGTAVGCAVGAVVALRGSARLRRHDPDHHSR